MKIERVMEIFSAWNKTHGLRLVKQIGNRFIVNKESTLPVEDSEKYEIYIPLETKKGEIKYNETTVLNNPILGVLPKTVKQGEQLKPVEAWYVMKRNPDTWSTLMEPLYGSWSAKKSINLAWFAKGLDDAWYARLSEVMEVELIRGLIMDYKRSATAGFSGFNSTNGSLQYLLSEYAMFGVPVSKHRMGTVIFNREITREDKSDGLIDLSCIPQDVDATMKMSVVYGVQVVDNKLKKTKRIYDSAYTLTNVPFRKFVNEKRMVIQRASSQSLPLHFSEKAFVRNPGGANIPGLNAVVYRTEEAGLDSYILSESFAKRMIAVKPVEYNYILPNNTRVVNLFTPIPEEEVIASLNLGISVPRIRPGKGLFMYYRHELGACENILSELTKEGGQMEELSKHMLDNKPMVEVVAVENFTPTSTKTTQGWSKGPVTIHNIKGYQIIEVKVGSKLMDRFSSKGTVSEIRKDEDMPLIEVNGKKVRVDVMYNPSIYKRKVALAYKAEGLIGLHYWIKTDGAKNGETVLVPKDIEYKELFKDNTSGNPVNIPRGYRVNYKGETKTSFRVGLHFITHLDHDPERKLQYSTRAQNKVTLIDRNYMKKMGFKIQGNLDKANQIGLCIGKSVSIVNDLPVFKDVETVVPESAFKIETRISKEYMYTDIGLLPRSAVHGTVGDPRLKEQYAFIETELGKVLIPPGCFESFEDKKNYMVLTSELINANNILAEQLSINYLRYELSTAKVANNKQLKELTLSKIQLGRNKLKKLIEQYRIKLAKRFVTEMSRAYNVRLPGIYGVATCDNSLPIDTVGIPRHVWNKLKRFSNTHGLFRRHPIHRIYNCMPVKLVPADGYTIRVNEKLMRLADGDFDGDCVEVMFVSPKQLGIFRKYNPNNLIKGYTDISLKKSTRREKSTAQLAYDQKELKLYTAISGSIAIELSERARTCGYGYTQVSELYHFMAQLALNLKHRRDGIDLIKKLSGHFLGLQKEKLSLTEFISVVKELNPNFKEKDLRKLKGLFKSESTKSLNFTRNNVNPKYIEELAGSVKLTEKQEKEIAARQFIV
jgi:hypothetical protein